MPKDIILDSKGKAYEDQKALVQKHAQTSRIPYKLPQALEAATTILVHQVETGERLYSDIWTLCREKMGNTQWPAASRGFTLRVLTTTTAWGVAGS